MMVQSKRPAFDKILSICADQRRSEDNVRPRCLRSLINCGESVAVQVYGNFTREFEGAVKAIATVFFHIKQ